jgi:hypothetical protein
VTKKKSKNKLTRKYKFNFCRFYWMKDVDDLYVVQCTGEFLFVAVRFNLSPSSNQIE